jgi:hypothetical protein
MLPLFKFVTELDLNEAIQKADVNHKSRNTFLQKKNLDEHSHKLSKRSAKGALDSMGANELLGQRKWT